MEVIITLGPLGPFLHRGVEVVSQLAQRRARRGSPPPLLLPARWGLFEDGGGVCLDGIMFHPKLDMQEERFFSWWWWPFSLVTRVDGVPNDKVQSTEAEEGEEEAKEYNSPSS